MQAKIGTRTVDAIEPREKPYEINDTDLKGFGIRVQPSGIATYFCTYRLPDGRKNRVSIGRTTVLTPVQARDEARTVLGDVAKGLDPNKGRKASGQMTLERFLATKYSSWVTAERKTGKQTIQTIRFSFKSLLDQKLAEITPWKIEKWRTEKLKTGVKPATINRNLAALKACFSKAVEWGDCELHPIARVKLSKVDPNKKVRFLSSDESRRLLTALNKRENLMRHRRASANQWRAERRYSPMADLEQQAFADYLKPMVLVSLNTGLRRGELFSLEWTSVDWERRLISVEGAHAKSGKTRHVPMNQTCFDTLQQWQRQTNPESGLVFPGTSGGMLDNVKRSWTAVLEQAEISNFRWHDMRHDFASQLVMNGVDLNTVRDLLGHADIKTTLIYAHLSPRTKMDAVRKLDSMSLISSTKQTSEVVSA